MADTSLARDGIEANAARSFLDMRRQVAQGRGNFLHAPLQQLPLGCDGDGHQREIGALAHIIAPRARLEGITVVDESVEVFALLARNPVGFERHPFTPAGSNIDEAQAIRPKQADCVDVGGSSFTYPQFRWLAGHKEVTSVEVVWISSRFLVNHSAIHLTSIKGANTNVTSCSIPASVEPGEDDKNYSIESQLCDIRTWAGEHGHVVGPVYSDPGGRSYTLNRLVLQNMLTDARTGNFDIVCVGRFDRFSRIQVQCTVAIYLFREAGVEVSSATEPLPEGAVGEFVRNGIIFAAETELGNIRMRTYGGKRSRVHSGKLPSSPWPKYGYQYADDKKERYVPNPETAPVILRIFNLYAAGATIRAIEKTLTDECVPTPFTVLEKMGRKAAKRGGEAAWYGSTVFTILTNPAYIGKLVGFRTKYETHTIIHPITGERRATRRRVARSADDPNSFAYGPEVCPPLVSEEIFAAVQERLRQNKERASLNTKHPGEILLRSGLIRCGYCGGYCVAMWNKTGQVYRYGCNNRLHHHRNCPAPTRFSVLTNVLDEVVWNYFIEQLSHPELIAAAYQSYQDGVGALSEQRAHEVDATKAAIKDAADEEESYLAAVGGARSDAMRARFVNLAEDAHVRLVELEVVLAKLELGAQAQAQDVAVIRAFAEGASQAVERLKNASIEDKRKALYRFKVQVTLWAKEHDPHWTITWMKDFV